MAIERLKTYTNGELYTLQRLDRALSLRHNLEQLTKAGIHEKRVFLHSDDKDPRIEKEHRIPITPNLMMGVNRVVWGLSADALNMGLMQEAIDIAEKYEHRDTQK